MSGCRIGKIRMKNGGADIHVIQNERRSHFHTTLENLSHSLSNDVHAVGFFVLYKNGEVTSGLSYDAGFTASQLKGACEHMKDCLMEDVWGNHE